MTLKLANHSQRRMIEVFYPENGVSIPVRIPPRTTIILAPNIKYHILKPIVDDIGDLELYDARLEDLNHNDVVDLADNSTSGGGGELGDVDGGFFI